MARERARHKTYLFKRPTTSFITHCSHLRNVVDLGDRNQDLRNVLPCAKFFFVYFVVLLGFVLFPLAATAQTGNSTEVSDKAFLAVIKARDDKQVFVTELNQIKSYNDKLKSRGFNSPVHRNLRASEGVKNLLR
jgi:hypothetical protein